MMGVLTRIKAMFANLVRSKRDEPREHVYYPSRTAGVTVNEETALKLSVYWACIRVIAETIALLPWDVIRRTNGRREIAEEHVVQWLIHTQPNPEMTAFDFRQLLMAWALGSGNGYAEIERDTMRRPVWLWPIAPDRVTPLRDDAGKLWYQVDNFTGEPAYIAAEDMLHLKGLSFDGLVGQNAMQAMALALGIGLAAQQEKSSFYSNGCRMAGFWVNNGATMSDVAEENFLKSINRRHQGPKRAFNIGLVQGTMDWKPAQITYVDSQVLESEKFTVRNICRYFRMQPHKVADLDNATFSNIEWQSMEHVTDTIMPWVIRLESEANIKLFGRQQRGGYVTKMNLKALLRGDNESRGRAYRALWDMGVLSTNEIRELEDLNPVGADGDKRFVQLNLTTLAKAGEEPPKPVQPPTETPQEDDDDEEPPDEPKQPQDRSVQRAAFIDACTTAVKRECHRVRDAMKRLEGEAFANWIPGFYAEHREYLRNKLAMPMKALLNGRVVEASLNRTLEVVAANACAESETDLHLARANEDVGGCLESWERDRAGEMVNALVEATLLLVSLASGKDAA